MVQIYLFTFSGSKLQEAVEELQLLYLHRDPNTNSMVHVQHVLTLIMPSHMTGI